MNNINFSELLDHLIEEESAEVDLYGIKIQLSLKEHLPFLSLSSVVYKGGNYIPKSVRGSLKEEEHPFESSMPVTLSIDERQYQISLNYKASIEDLNTVNFKEILEEFCFLAEEWRSYLDEHDRHDLVYIHAK